jgi:uncharacterized protein YozE (UPF0346 family)
MTFWSFLKIHLKAETPIGDLARDVQADAHFPRKATTFEEIAGYLETKGMCEGAADAFRHAWFIWKLS